MKFSLVYTSRRAQCIEPVIMRWLCTAANPSDVEVILALDADYADGWKAVSNVSSESALSRTRVCKNDGPNTCVAGWNAAAALATGDVLIAIADDFEPCEKWDEELTKAGPDGWWKQDRVVAVSDGYNPDILTLAICTRARYDRFGYLFYPSYESLFGDTEFGVVARSENVVIDARHLLFEHMHPDCGKRPRDATDLTHASTGRWKRGEMLFELRRDTGFPVDAGPVAEALEAAYEAPKFAAYVQAIRDDFCLYEVIKRVLDDSAGAVTTVFICAPDEYWGGKPQSAADLDELIAVQDHLRVDYTIPIKLVHQAVAPVRAPGLTRIQVETVVRNNAVQHIRALGFQHILILDGDELWKPGLFARLVDFVRERRPASVYTGMTPTIGLPGWPIEGATDKATIYIGPGAWFVDCRGVSGHRHELVSYDVIHFTATRRTMAEIISKSRESGHADDKNYDFERWISDVLPNVRPDFTYRWSPTNVGLHMYLPGCNIWPKCRAWTQQELALIPDSVKPYMSQPKDTAF